MSRTDKLTDDELFTDDYVVIEVGNESIMEKLVNRVKQLGYKPNSDERLTNIYLHIDNRDKVFTTSHYGIILKRNAGRVKFIDVDVSIYNAYLRGGLPL